MALDANENYELTAREKIVEVAKRLYARNLLAAADGNVSVRLSDDRIMITPSGRAKADLSPEEMAVMNLSGEVIIGQPSSERLLHLEVYRRCPKAKAVVHAHPPTAIAWSLAHPHLGELPSEALPEVILAAGRIPIVPYARPSTPQMASVLEPFLPHTRLMILSRHGGLGWGESLEEAAMALERLEHVAQILMSAQVLGGAKPLDAAEVTALREMRAKMGERIL